jgi:hypothetical protein
VIVPGVCCLLVPDDYILKTPPVIFGQVFDLKLICLDWFYDSNRQCAGQSVIDKNQDNILPIQLIPENPMQSKVVYCNTALG